ncbi:MAG TPA: response regulator transcription factor [Candidatus Thermoplasmatota archaeon]
MGQVERIRTLLVEDDAPMRVLLRRALEETGHFEVIAEAADGVNAIERATLLQPELILLDLMMPIMNGFQALPLLLKSSPVSRIVVLSMLQGNPIEKECLQLGASAFVDKMVKDEDLIKQILAAMHPTVVHESETVTPRLS